MSKFTVDFEQLRKDNPGEYDDMTEEEYKRENMTELEKAREKAREKAYARFNARKLNISAGPSFCSNCGRCIK
jgi:PDZ domain-containing secreted protein